MDSIGGEILDQPEIERAVRIEREAPAQRRRMASIGRRADVTQIGGGDDVSDCAGVAAATQVAVPAVPGHGTCSRRAREIDLVRRQADTNL